MHAQEGELAARGGIREIWYFETFFYGLEHMLRFILSEFCSHCINGFSYVFL